MPQVWTVKAEHFGNDDTTPSLEKGAQIANLGKSSATSNGRHAVNALRGDWIATSIDGLGEDSSLHSKMGKASSTCLLDLVLYFIHEYLMHAVLTISASHLYYLQPQISRYAKATSMHLDRALSGFRSSLGGTNLPQQEVDVIIACGFILLHYAWSIPYFNVPNNASPSIESDGLMRFAAGVKAVILAVYEKEPRSGIFHAYLRADRVRQFYAWSAQECCSYDFERHFLRQTFTEASREVPEGDCLQRECGNANAAERLMPIFRAVDAITRGQDISNIIQAIVAYSLMWPSKAMQAFQDEVKDKYPGAMITMLSFYASSLLILSGRAWWAHHRSKAMCESLLAHLTQEKPGGWEQNVSKIIEYFGFNRNSDGNWEVENPNSKRALPPTVGMANIMFEAPKPRSFLGYHRQLAPTAAVKVSPLCLGTMGFGTQFAELMGPCNKEASFKLLDFFYKNGGNFIDTANVYQNGESELIVGDWMKERGNRDEIVLATKYTSAWQLANPEVNIQSNFGGNNKKSMHVAFKASLQRLQTTYVDLFYVHTWDFTTSIPELMHALHGLVTSGRVLYLGISNTPAWVVSKANEYARQKGLTMFSVYQGQWSAAEREVEREILPMCNDQGMALIPYGVLGSGSFRTSAQRSAEQTQAESKPKSGQQKREGRNIAFTDKPQKTVMADALEKIAIAKGTRITSVALAWARLKGPYIFPVIGARKVEHLKDSIEALGLELTSDDVEEIEKAVPFDFGYPQTILGGSGGATQPGDVWLTKRFGTFDWVASPQPPKQHSN
ncbi:hypothetical protein DL765_005582 [Monosporascus sp. GIB2]|nr:hypothetical protein DL765_005582 [Monosporascus sp. GIB2]